MEYQTNSSKRVATMAIMIALAMIFSYIEAILPFNIGIPGVKLGIANIVVILALYILDEKAAVIVSLIRILLAGIMFSGIFAALFGLGGAVLSLIVMILLKKSNKFSIVGVSMAGGVVHNIGQLLIATIIMGTLKIFLYFPVLLFSGMITGIIIGVLAYYIKKTVAIELSRSA